MVRLAKEPFWTRRTIVSFGSCVAAAIIMLLVWWQWPRNESQLAYQRDVREIKVPWRCPNHHVFESPGRLDPIPCPQCHKPAEIELEFYCSTHGEISFLVRYRISDQGRAVLDRFSSDGKTWKSVADGLTCPQCGKMLKRQP